MTEKTLNDMLVIWEEIQLNKKVKMCKVPYQILKNSIKKLKVKFGAFDDIAKKVKENPLSLPMEKMFIEVIEQYKKEIGKIFGDLSK